ncbi:PadR family transcriptional regulator [Ectobacillus ponti]|uniref:PadR family transcriptional regulator n=1 Tax=Ectobacillus ponti TaxID=2961894 RepID=A0AA41X407_9BACI|nr:PadR family transcriptional regulator [Ectobacillus ponti]MCP8968332.1 PadR family transcriptional regulator [Ectobacillus ponti]
MSIRLVILGLLMEGAKHPYEIHQIMEQRQMKHYIKLAKGSLYYAFEKLEEQGRIEVVDVVRDTNRPDRTIYQITAAGQAEFHELLLEHLLQHEHRHRPIYAALAFAEYGKQEEISAKLAERLGETKLLLERMRKLYEQLQPKETAARMYVIVRVIQHLQTEVNWLVRLHADAEAGRLNQAGLPVLEQFEGG